MLTAAGPIELARVVPLVEALHRTRGENITDESSAVERLGLRPQLVPGEAMVKHHPGFNAATNDWEFFELDTAATGTKIKVRGTTNAVNQFGGNCLACHAKAEAKWDMICEQGHGCDPIPLTPVMVNAIQKTDPRCSATALPAEETASLEALRPPTPAP